MSHLTDPWLEARKGLSEDDVSNRVIELAEMNFYADKIIREYNIEELNDLKKYSLKLFDRINNLC